MQQVISTSKQTRFVQEFLVDANGAAAAVRAGYAPGSAKVAASRMLSKDNPVRRAIQARQDADAERLGVSRSHVLAGLQEAIKQAREQGNPVGMIRGWVEVAKMLGLYEPEARRVEVSGAVDSVLQSDYRTMSDRELLALIAQGAGAA